jgi:hypothetical protein
MLVPESRAEQIDPPPPQKKSLVRENLQQDYDFANDAPARVPDESAVFVEGYV